MIGALGRATVEAKEGVAVWGGLWLVPANELSAMDGLAGVADGHSERTTRRVVSSGGPCIEAMVYIASPGGLPGKNAAAAVAEVIAGARESHLPAAYIKELQTWENAGA